MEALVFGSLFLISLSLLFVRSWRFRLSDSITEEDKNSLKPLPHQLRVITQNVWCHYFATNFFFGVIRGVASPVMHQRSFKKRLEVLASQIKKANVDIVFIQELFLLRIGPFIIHSDFNYFKSRMAEIGWLKQINYCNYFYSRLC